MRTYIRMLRNPETDDIEGVMESDFFIRYTSPTILLASVALLLLFARLRLRGLWEKAAVFLSPMAFGVYLIHTQPLVWANLMKKFVCKVCGYIYEGENPPAECPVCHVVHTLVGKRVEPVKQALHCAAHETGCAPDR